MPTRVEIIKSFYDQVQEDNRLTRSCHGRLEYAVTMYCIHRYAKAHDRVLEIGAGSGRYSIALAKEGMDVTSVELLEHNLEILRQNAEGLQIKAIQADATSLDMLEDESFDLTLSLGPMYHLYDAEDINKAIDEAIRVTRHGGVILFAFLSVYALMYANYLYGRWADGEKENFDKDYAVRHFKEQLFTGYDVVEFESLFAGKPITWLTTVGTDGMLEAVEPREDFTLSEEDFQAFAAWHLAFAEKRELLGSNNHLLYICRRQ